MTLPRPYARLHVALFAISLFVYFTESQAVRVFVSELTRLIQKL
jgi:hypothetical protein